MIDNIVYLWGDQCERMRKNMPMWMKAEVRSGFCIICASEFLKKLFAEKQRAALHKKSSRSAGEGADFTTDLRRGGGNCYNAIVGYARQGVRFRCADGCRCARPRTARRLRT